MGKRDLASKGLVWFLFAAAAVISICCAFEDLKRDVTLGERVTALEASVAELDARVTELEQQVGQLPLDEDLPAGAGLVVALAKNDLASRLGVHPDSVQVVEVIRVSWIDNCLGVYGGEAPCVQGITVRGFKVTLSAADRLWRYHTDARSRIVYVGPVLQDLAA